MSEVRSKLHKFIVEKILLQPNRIIGNDEPVISSGLVDSFSLIDLALFVEDTFNVRIYDTELNTSVFDTLSQLAKIIEERQAKS